MTLVSLIFVLIIAGFACWLLSQVPVAEPFRKIIIGVIIFFTVIWIGQQMGFLPGNLRLR